MGNRRMFSKLVVANSIFLSMPRSARLLYYDLGMNADDDGAVDAGVVMKLTGAKQNDLNKLIENGFIAVLNNFSICYIIDFNENNLIRQDRYKEGRYKSLVDTWLSNGCQMVSLSKDKLSKEKKREEKLSFSKESKERKVINMTTNRDEKIAQLQAFIDSEREGITNVK